MSIEARLEALEAKFTQAMSDLQIEEINCSTCRGTGECPYTKGDSCWDCHGNKTVFKQDPDYIRKKVAEEEARGW